MILRALGLAYLGAGLAWTTYPHPLPDGNATGYRSASVAGDESLTTTGSRAIGNAVRLVTIWKVM